MPSFLKLKQMVRLQFTPSIIKDEILGRKLASGQIFLGKVSNPVNLGSDN